MEKAKEKIKEQAKLPVDFSGFYTVDASLIGHLQNNYKVSSQLLTRPHIKAVLEFRNLSLELLLHFSYR